MLASFYTCFLVLLLGVHCRMVPRALRVNRILHDMEHTSYIPVGNTGKSFYDVFIGTEDLVKQVNNVCIPNRVFKGCEQCMG